MLERTRERLILFVLATIQFSHTSDFVLMMPLGPQLMRVLNISTTQFSLLLSSYTWSAGISGFIASLFVDRYDRKHVLLTCYCGFLVGTFLCGVADRYEYLLAARVVAGAFGGTLAAGVFSILADVIPSNRRGAATGVILSAFSVASVLGIPAGLFLASHYSWPMPFLAIAALGVIVWFLAAWKLPPLRGHLAEEEIPGGGDLRYVITHGPHVRAYLLTITVIGAGFLVIPFVSPYLVSNVGLRESDLIYVYLLGGSLTFFSSRWVGALADRYGAVRVYYAMALSSILPLLAMTHLPRVPMGLTLTVTGAFWVLVSGRWVPAMSLITSASLPRVRGAFLSFNSSVQQIALGLATYAAGHIVSRAPNGELAHYRVAGWLAAAVTLSSLWLAGRVVSVEKVYKSAA